MAGVKSLQKELRSLSEGGIALLETSPEKVTDTSADVIKAFVDNGYTGIVLSASRPCTNILDIYAKKKIDTEHVLILDCVCKSQSIDPPKHENVIHLQHVSDLTNISIAISDAIKAIEGKKVLFVDSVTTMLIHNNPEVFARFIHRILVKLRMSGVSGVLMSAESETNKEVGAEIAQLCDKVLKI